MLHAEFEGLGVDFPQGAGVEPGVSIKTVGFLAVGRKMFGRSAYTLGLYAIDVCRGYHTGENRILGKILEVPAVQGIAQNVHAGSQDDIVAHIERLFAYRLTDGAGDSPVPTGSGQQAGREACSLVLAQAYADRPIHHYYGRNTKPWDRVGDASGSGKVFAFVRRLILLDPDHEESLLFGCHGFHDFRDVVFVKSGLSGCARTGESQADGSDDQSFHDMVRKLYLVEVFTSRKKAVSDCGCAASEA